MPNQQDDNTVNILHLSDLHLGLKEQSWMWPTFKTAFYEDLKALHKKNGPWHLVIFSGDLTQCGSKEEFDQLTITLKELWSKLSELGSHPKLFVVPGNHDLSRPSETDPVGIVLKQWWNAQNIHTEFWNKTTSSYRIAVQSWFKNYTEWHESVKSDIPIIEASIGILPGDISAIFNLNGLSIGLVGLNSSWLQHTGGNRKKELCIHPLQLLALTKGDADLWCKSNQFNLIITHHPTDWLHPKAATNWAAEINPAGRFDIHLFGHMHEGLSSTISISGSIANKSIQAASIFGLDAYGTENEQRSHGYSIIQIGIKNSAPLIRIWPRKLVARADGSRRLMADQEWDLLEDSYCDLNTLSTEQASKETSIPSQLIEISATRDDLARLCRPIFNIPAHSAVRKSEQAIFAAALREKRQAWLVTDWGLGGNEFLETVRGKLINSYSPIYYLDFHNYQTQEDILAGLPVSLGYGIESLSSGLSEVGDAILVLDDIDIRGSFADTARDLTIADQLTKFSKVLIDFCPKLLVIFVSRVRPANPSMRVLELKPLDEPDTKQYILSHEKGGETFAKQEAVLRIFRHTDGVPANVDSVLRSLQAIGLGGLHELDTDVGGKLDEHREISSQIARAINDLANSKYETHIRSYDLLRVLSIFPQGQQLIRIKRFFGARGFHANHVSILLDRALIDTVDLESLYQPSISAEDGKALVVRRPIREHVIQRMEGKEFQTLCSRSLSLYFGSDWATKGIRTPTYLKFTDSKCEPREIGNASTMILRAVNSANDSGNKNRIQQAFSLITAYGAQLRTGGHFRSIASLYEEFFLSQGDQSENIILETARMQYAGALRMIGENKRAQELFNQCESTTKSNSVKQSALLAIALCLESLNDDPAEIIAAAKRCLKINPKNSIGLQAKGIIALNDPTITDNRDVKLAALQKEALRKKSYMVANNIALDRAAATDDLQTRTRLYREATDLALREKDFYNYIRGTLKLARQSITKDRQISPEQLAVCTKTYSYLYNQRMHVLFNECHDILWTSFATSDDTSSLLTLFKYSSLIWRLRDDAKKERSYIQKLAPLINQRVRNEILSADQSLVYFLTRSMEVISSQPIGVSQLPAAEVTLISQTSGEALRSRP